MAETIRQVDYFYLQVPHKAGEAAKALRTLKDAGVNLLAFSGFPEGRRAQLDFIPADAAAFKSVARANKWKVVGPKRGFVIQGDDRVGAIADVVGALADAKINVTAIDAVCADHTPEDIENKKKEFDYAAFGITSLETCFATLNTFAGKKLSPDKMIQALAINPRKILGLPVPVIKENAKANLTLFDLNRSWIPKENELRSKSKNSPFFGIKLKGKAVAVYNNNQWIVV